ncbi:collagen-like protein [Aeromicrobium sp. CF4.19]|uniref:collagen-like triple helix repeat-containing protein n=1 Tax=Aeromicrobium sp. CF4.19 TaxID=3373082 RepID=UPI003EE514DD
MRRLGWVVTILGVLLVALGAAGGAILGPDSRFTTGPHAVDTAGTVIVTSPGVISYSGLQVDVLAEVPVNKPVFVGLGNSVDVEDYVAETERIEVTDFRTPWEPQSREVDGRPGLPGAPTALDWWLADAAGLGGASISTTLPDETVSLAIVAVGATNLSGLEVTMAYGLKGGFAASIGVVLLGAGGLLGGHALRRGQRMFIETEADEELEVVEEIVYVYVDEDGVEHEISAEEAAELEAAEPEGEEPGDPGPAEEPGDPGPAEEPGDPGPAEEPGDPGPVEEPAPYRPPATANVMTAADFVQDATEVGPPAVPGPSDPVVYVFVDEDGVEHEVSEDELDEYEVLDEEET